MTFQLHPTLANDTSLICSLDVCDVLLMDDSRYPWLILVPRVDDLRELHEVAPDTATVLWREIRQCALLLEQHTGAFKMNVAALGNMVPQLHIHIIARFESDPTWPGPVWGVGEPQPYSPTERTKFSAAFNALVTTS